MADIHVLIGSMNARNKRKVRKHYAFHFPIDVGDQSAAAVQDPDLIAFVSEVPDIQTTESDAIKAGEIVEKVITLTYNRAATNGEIATKVRAEYNGMAVEVTVEYVEKYRQYLVELSA